MGREDDRRMEARRDAARLEQRRLDERREFYRREDERVERRRLEHQSDAREAQEQSDLRDQRARQARERSQFEGFASASGGAAPSRPMTGEERGKAVAQGPLGFLMSAGIIVGGIALAVKLLSGDRSEQPPQNESNPKP